MNIPGLLADLEQLGVRFEPGEDRLLVDAPPGALTPVVRATLEEHKAEILQELRQRQSGAPPPNRRERRSLAFYAADLVPPVRFTLRETRDVVADVALLRRIRAVIEEHQPGANRVLLRIVRLDGRQVTVLWRALDAPSLRRGIATILARNAGRQQRAATKSEGGGTPNDDRR